MRVLKHIYQQPFIAATGIAALVHSTWALGTLFAGEQPQGWHLMGWLLPALLIAFALDVGQIATSAEIRAHGLTWQRGVTFGVFAAATYYLQWLYIAHHMPALSLAAGVRESWSGFATVMRDAAVWIIPALLPLSTLLYTFSGQRDRAETRPITEHFTHGNQGANSAMAVAAKQNTLMADPEPVPLLEPATRTHTATCKECGWTKQYDSAESATRGLATHQARHCTAMHPEFSVNGKVQHGR